jgi:hypothetical protein
VAVVTEVFRGFPQSAEADVKLVSYNEAGHNISLPNLLSPVPRQFK